MLMCQGASELSGWALNISRGGIRVILEDKVELGQEYEVAVGDDAPGVRRRGRVVWVQEEQDGVIAGVEFTDAPTSDAPPLAPRKT